MHPFHAKASEDGQGVSIHAPLCQSSIRHVRTRRNDGRQHANHRARGSHAGRRRTPRVITVADYGRKLEFGASVEPLADPPDWAARVAVAAERSV